MTRVLVLAHGDGRRWCDESGAPFLGIPKHLVEIEGETLLGRACRLMLARGCEVIVVGPDDRYRVPGCALEHLDAINACGCDMGKLLDCRHLWSTTERTVIMWGDVWYSEECADSIASRDGGDYHVWRRPGRSRTTGHKWDESFAVSFGPGEHARVIDRAEYVAGLVASGQVKASHIRSHLAAMDRLVPAMWENLRRVAKLPSQTHVDDWTDDFDSPAEWEAWTTRRARQSASVGVCIPWCGGDSWRTRSFEWTRAHWESLGVPIYIGADSTGGEWPNRSAARNDAASRALADGVEVLFFADSDTWVSADQLWDAALGAGARGQLVLAFDVYLRVSRRRTESLINARKIEWRRLRASAYRSTSHASGAMAIPASLWHTVGGYDERFVRWGFEDRAFWLACNTLAGEAPRVSGPAAHWWHPTAEDKDRSSPDFLAGEELGRRYKFAAAFAPKAGAMSPIVLPEGAVPDPDEMRRILAEPGGPLATEVVV
jgi:hypothetical protein